MLAIMINRLTINLHQRGKRSTTNPTFLVPLENRPYPISSPPAWMINIKDSDSSTDADTTKEPTSYSYSYGYSYGPPPPTPVSYDGTNGVELVKIGRAIR